MTMPDKDLDRMVKNLKKAFDAASRVYEAMTDYRGASDEHTRKGAIDLAAISQAYLAAVQEQDKRAEEASKRLLAKSLKTLKQ